MKCARHGCPKDAAINQKYCSAEHAPYAHLCGYVHDTQSMKKARSSIQMCGGPSVGLLEKRQLDAYKTLKEIRTPFIEPKIMPTVAADIGKIPSQLESKKNSDGPTYLPKKEQPLTDDAMSESSEIRITIEREENGMPEIETPSSQKSSTAEKPGNSLLLLEPSSTNVSKTLEDVNESIVLLRDFMASLKEEKGQKIPIPNINAACNCAKNITNLLRFKLDLMKVLKPVS